MVGEKIARWFRKEDPRSLVPEDLKQLIANRTQENLNLEFKSGRLLKKGEVASLGKAISAFANSDGGILILGVDEDKKKEPPVAGDLSPVTISKESFEQKLLSSVQPWPENTLIVPVEMGGGSRVFVIEVPSLHYPPVQDGSTRAYYYRANFQNVPMSHDMLQRAFNRGLRPSLRPLLEVVGHSEDKDRSRTTFRLMLRNCGQIAATHLAIVIGFELSWIEIDMRDKDGRRLKETISDVPEGRLGSSDERFKETEGKGTSAQQLQVRTEEPTYLGIDHLIGQFYIDVEGQVDSFKIIMTILCLECPAESFEASVGDMEIQQFQSLEDGAELALEVSAVNKLDS